MTTLVVVRKAGQVAIAADSLTTFGDLRLSASMDRSWHKIQTYQDKVGQKTLLGISGSAAHQLVFESLLAQEPDLKFDSKKAIFETLRYLHPLLKEKHFLNPKDEDDDPYESTHLTALIASSSGIFGIYSMREVFEFTQFWAAGSGREFAIGAMSALYDTDASAETIAKAGVVAGCTFDKNSALPLSVQTLPLAPSIEVAHD